MSSPCQVAMETDLQVSKTDLYLLGICSFLDALTSIKQRERDREREKERERCPPSPLFVAYWEDIFLQ